MSYYANPIVDGFLLAGHGLSQLKRGFRWLPETVIRGIESVELVAPCLHCNAVPEHGWVTHAALHHCENFQVSREVMKNYRLSCGRQCLLCNITYGNENERKTHIRIHLGQRLLLYYKMPIYKPGDPTVGSINEEAVRLKSFLHYSLHKDWNLRLYFMIPSWLQGNTIKEKLRSIDRPTYIPISTGRKTFHLFTAEIHKHYDLYSTLLYAPAFDENFNGVCQYNRAHGMLMIRLLSSLKQTPEALKNIRFQLYKEPNPQLFVPKYLVQLQDEDVNDVLKDVLTKKRTVICCNDLFNDTGCEDITCRCMVHFSINCSLEKEASRPLDSYKTLNRHDNTRYGLGKFELIENPNADLWMSFAQEVIRKKNHELEERTPFFVYVVLCTHAINTTEMPTLQNIADFYGGDEDIYKAYVGYSYRSGIPKQHFPDFLNREIDDIDSDAEENDNADGEARLVGTTELTKTIFRGNNSLFILRNYMEDTYEDAVKLEALIQLYFRLSEENGIGNSFKIVNKRLELSALTYLSNEELEVILRLIQLQVPLLYESPEDYETYLREHDLTEIDWGIIRRPFFMSELQRLPL